MIQVTIYWCHQVTSPNILLPHCCCCQSIEMPRKLQNWSHHHWLLWVSHKQRVVGARYGAADKVLGRSLFVSLLTYYRPHLVTILLFLFSWIVDVALLLKLFSLSLLTLSWTLSHLTLSGGSHKMVQIWWFDQAGEDDDDNRIRIWRWWWCNGDCSPSAPTQLLSDSCQQLFSNWDTPALLCSSSVGRCCNLQGVHM